MKARYLALSVLMLGFPFDVLMSAPPAGQVVTWGRNIGGQPNSVPPSWDSDWTGIIASGGRPLTGVVAIAAGGAHALALKADGTVFGWGSNRHGQATGESRGTPTPTNGLVIIQGSVLSNVVAVAAGSAFSLALRGDGSVVAWGEDDSGQTRIPAGLGGVVAIAAGYNHALALKDDGTVVQWGGGEFAPPALLRDVVAIAAGGASFNRDLALKRGGTVVGWGDETVFHDAAAPATLSNVTAIAVGEHHSLAVRSDGTVVGWGYNGSGEATGIATTNAPYISSGVVKIAGRTLSNAVAVAAGNEYGRIGIACRMSMALRKDGTVVAWGKMGLTPATSPPGLSNVVAIAAGQGFCLAITTNSAGLAR